MQICMNWVKEELVVTCIGFFETIHDDLVVGDALSLVDAVLVQRSDESLQALELTVNLQDAEDDWFFVRSHVGLSALHYDL